MATWERLQYEYTRFEVASEYFRLYALENDGKTWLMGDTKPIIIKGFDQHKGMEWDWSLGSFTVAFCLKDLVAAINKHHFIPLANPMTTIRHPHHYASVTSRSDLTRNPLDMIVSTCWYGFATVVMHAVHERDVAGLFSMIFKYLSRYDSSSVLGGWYTHGVENVEWMKKENSQRSKST